jgi:hypothetical protein
VSERTDHADAVDWDVAVRHERRREVLLALMCFVAFPALAVLRFDDRRILVGAVALAVVAVLGTAAWTFHGVRTGRTDRYRALHALVAYSDPGPGLRTRTDELARQQAANRYVFWLAPAGLLIQAVPGRWDEPMVALPAAAVLVISLLPLTVHQYRLGRAAKRWLDAPPGPPREADPGWVPPPRKQWASSRGLVALVGVGVVAVALLVITVAESGP